MCHFRKLSNRRRLAIGSGADKPRLADVDIADQDNLKEFKFLLFLNISSFCSVIMHACQKTGPA